MSLCLSPHFLSSLDCGPLTLLFHMLKCHILAWGPFPLMNRWVCCLVIHHQPSTYNTEVGRGRVLCLRSISLRVPNLVFLKGSEVWAAEEVGETNPILGDLNLENLEGLTGFQNALKLSEELCICILIFPRSR